MTYDHCRFHVSLAYDLQTPLTAILAIDASAGGIAILCAECNIKAIWIVLDEENTNQAYLQDIGTRWP